jgi:hypothetical protein
MILAERGTEHSCIAGDSTYSTVLGKVKVLLERYRFYCIGTGITGLILNIL